MFVKPGTYKDPETGEEKQLKVRDPFRKDLIEADGREVSDTDGYWIRRLRDGDVVKTEPPAPETPAPEAAAEDGARSRRAKPAGETAAETPAPTA